MGIRDLAKAVRKVGDTIPNGATEGLGEYLTESHDSDVRNRVWYAIGYLDAVKALASKKSVRYEACAEQHTELKRIAKLLEAAALDDATGEKLDG